MNAVLTPNAVEKEKMRIAKQAMKEDVFSEYEKLKERDKAMVVKEVNLNEYYCPACGTEIFNIGEKETHKFCLNCGQRIDWREEGEDGYNHKIVHY